MNTRQWNNSRAALRQKNCLNPMAMNFVREDFHELNDNGAWLWFMVERAIAAGGRLIVGSVGAVAGLTALPHSITLKP